MHNTINRHYRSPIGPHGSIQRAYLLVSGEISTEVAAHVDGVVLVCVLLHNPQLLTTHRKRRRVDVESKRLGRQVLAVVVDETDFPRRQQRGAITTTPRRQHTIHGGNGDSDNG